MSYAWQTSTVQSSGETIYYEVTGDGPNTVMLTHGAGGTHAAWFQQVPALCAAGCRVLTWDCRGFGNSSFTSGAHGCDAAVADMTAILDASNTDRVHLVGQSMGGWWVTAFALAYPQRVRSLTLSNTVGGLWTDALHEHFRTALRGPLDGEPTIGAHPALSPALVARDPARAFLYQQLNTFHTPPMAAVGAALVGSSVEHVALDALDIPILMITGTDDVLFPTRFIAEAAAMIEHASYVEIANAGHSPYFERPDEYNAALLDFLAKWS